MNIVFEYSGKKLVLPVNPASVKVTKPSQSQKVEVIGTGEVSVPQKRKLASITISSFFWNDFFNQKFLLSGLSGLANYLSASTISSIIDDSQKFTVLNEYVKWFEDWQASKKPARWTIVVPPNEPPQCFDFNVTCENFSYEIRAGEDSDYYYELELLEWRDYGAKVMTEEKQDDGSVKFVSQPTARLETKAELASSEISTTAKDSIWSVAKKYCNGNWRDLVSAKANQVILATSPQDINGLIVTIPSKYM